MNWQEYESKKKMIAIIAMDSADYEHKISELTRKLKI